MTLADRFWSRIEEAPGGCLLWTGKPDRNGYGRVHLDGRHGRVEYAHRAAYYLAHGEWPPAGVDGDHHCPNKLCCREHPDHVRFVPHAENTLRSATAIAALCARKTHCLRGHPFSPENTQLVRRGNGRTERCCKTCEALRRAARRAPDGAVIRPGRTVREGTVV